MKKVGRTILWILGIIAWFFLLMMFWMADMTHGTTSHLLILLITGICLAIYIFRKTGSNTKDIEQENLKLKDEVQKLRQELEQTQTVQRVVDKTEQKKSEEAKK